MTDADKRQAFMFIARLISRDEVATASDLTPEAAAEVKRLRDVMWAIGKDKAPLPWRGHRF